MTSCCPLPRMRWSGTTGAIARCKRVSTGCGRTRRSGPAWPWICGVKPKPKAGNKPWQHCIVHGLDKPGSSATVSILMQKTNLYVCAILKLRLIEYALSCLLQPTASADWGYHLARQYAERYNSRYGTGLIPESAPLVEDIADFWCQYHLGKSLRAWMADSKAS